MKKIAFGMGAAALMFGACAEGPQNTTDDFGYDGTGIEFKVAPLTLDSLTDACYSFAVVNGSDQLVVGRGPSVTPTNLPGVLTGLPITGTATGAVCASQFGNTAGGDISYVAPCDAQATPSGNALHTVHLWVDALCATGTGAGCTEIQNYVNPCPDANGCTLDVTCVENADTPVTFNFTIMGQADQGFFDIAVNFDDVFCSAKMDTCNTLGEPIRIVFDDAGVRMDTLVLAVACTGGPGAGVNTHLTHSALAINCGAAGSGNLNLAPINQEGNFDLGTLNAAAYFGTESLVGVNKVYTNLAFGIPTGAACDVDWSVVPSNNAWANPSGGNTFNSYGYVRFVAKAIGTGTAGCSRFPMDGQPGQVAYNGATTPVVNGGIGGNGVFTTYGTGDFPGLSELQEVDGAGAGEDIVAWP